MPRSILALAALTLAAAPATADYLTPDSILRPPPPTHAGVQGTPVDGAGWVTTQYAGLGLDFPVTVPVWSRPFAFATAVASVGGVNVWAPVLETASGPWGSPESKLDFLGSYVKVAFAQPAGSLAVDLAWQGLAELDLSASRADGTSAFTSLKGGTGTHRLTLPGGGFVEFTVGGRPDYQDPASAPFAWGVAGVEFARGPVQSAPEPGALVLAVLGALGLLARHARALNGPQPAAPSRP